MHPLAIRELVSHTFSFLISLPPSPSSDFDKETLIEWKEQKDCLSRVNRLWSNICRNWPEKPHLNAVKQTSYTLLHNLMRGQFNRRFASDDELKTFKQWAECEFQIHKEHTLRTQQTSYTYIAGFDTEIQESRHQYENGALVKTDIQKIPLLKSPLISMALLPNHLSLNINKKVHIFSQKDKKILYSLPDLLEPKALMTQQQHPHLLYILDLHNLHVFDFLKSTNKIQDLPSKGYSKKLLWHKIKTIALLIFKVIKKQFPALFVHAYKFLASTSIVVGLFGFGAPMLFGAGFVLSLAVTAAVAGLIFTAYASYYLGAHLKRSIQEELDYLHNPYKIRI